MLGSEIIENLRKSRRPWGTGSFAGGTGRARFCVLGLKAREAGISIKTLRKYSSVESVAMALDDLGKSDILSNSDVRRLEHLEGFNDTDSGDDPRTKQNLIKRLGISQRPQTEYPIDKLIEALWWLEENDKEKAS